MEEKKENWTKRLYLSEFSVYDGEGFVTFNIVDIDAVKHEITAAVSRMGRVSVCAFDLKLDEDDCLYFEYGVMCDKIAVDAFEQVEEERT